MSFDLLAPHYRWMEFVLAGRKLQLCRTAFLREIPSPKNALLLGEGNGRFLTEFLIAHPNTNATCIDSSPQMMKITEERLRAMDRSHGDVEFICADIFKWKVIPNAYDLVVTNFFLDCFTSEQLEAVVEKISSSATSHASWLLADFCEPAVGMQKWRARLILQSMYFFFRWTTGLPARRLTAPGDYLHARQFQLSARRTYEWGLLHADLWQRSISSSGNHTVS